MSNLDLKEFNQAVALAQAGQKAEAFAILDKLSQLYPNEPNLLLWLAFTTDNPTIASRAIQKVSALDPSNPALSAARNWLQQLEGASNRNHDTFEMYSPTTAKPTASADTYSITVNAPTQSNLYRAANVNTPDSDLYQLRSESPQAANLPSTVSAPVVRANLDTELRYSPANNNRLIIVALSVGIIIIAVVCIILLLGGSNQASSTAITFVPPDKSFSILMPANPVPKTKNFSGGVTGTQYYVGLNNDLVQYAVTYSTYPKAVPLNQVGAFFNSLQGALLNQGYSLTTQKTFSVNQMPALYIEVAGQGEHLRLELVLNHGNELFEIDLLSKDNQTLPLEPQTYFDSFKLL